MTNDEKISKVKEILEQVNNMPENDSNQIMKHLRQIDNIVNDMPNIALMPTDAGWTVCVKNYETSIEQMYSFGEEKSVIDFLEKQNFYNNHITVSKTQDYEIFDMAEPWNEDEDDESDDFDKDYDDDFHKE